MSGALAYLLGVFTGILFLLIEKKSPFVRFHAAQSIGIFVAFMVFWVVISMLSVVLGIIPFIGAVAGFFFFLISLVVGFGGFILWLFLMYQAFQGKEWEFPFVGPQVRKMLR
ncbi:MAG: hypothetical protein EA351_06070 [Gemmatimonadales bacterium]|nr:MAG: hypothetical protein EA351_06070 [Gemmatimonadales bacterium]